MINEGLKIMSTKDNSEPKLLVKIKNQLKYRHILDIGGPMAIYSYSKDGLERKSFREAIPHILVAYNNIDDEELSYRSFVWTLSILEVKEFIEKLNFVEKDIKGKIKTGIFVFEKDFSKIYIKTGYIEGSETGKEDEVTKMHKVLYAENTNVKIETGEEFQDCLRGFTEYNEKAKSYHIVSAYMLEHREDLIDKILEAFSGYGDIADIMKYHINVLCVPNYSNYNDMASESLVNTPTAKPESK
jgi:hypothetical protein